MSFRFSLEDLTLERRHYIDRYLKRVINNRVRDYYRYQKKASKYGLRFVTLDEIDTILSYEQTFDRVSGFVEAGGFRIPVYSPTLLSALNQLTYLQKEVLIGNVVLSIPLNKIAQRLGISLRMVKKHKQKAIQSIKRRWNYEQDI